jgi:hypothetical protein
VRSGLLSLLLLLLPLLAQAVPPAGHVQLKLLVQRMNVNDYSIRKQLRVEADLTAPDAGRFAQLEQARLTVVSPAGVSAKVRPYRIKVADKKFKAARAEVVFKLVEDSASKQRSNVPRGYFAAEGPYGVRVELAGESYSGRVSFGAPIALTVSQAGQSSASFALDARQPIELVTAPQAFGPVYYKQQDVSNVFYQLANMDDALKDSDFRAEAESPQYFFQLRAGGLNDSKTQLIDPTAYIAGAQRGLIRSEQTLSPMVIPAGGLNAGQNLLIDFSRKETRQDYVFRSRSDSFSASAVVRERIVYIYELR